VQQEELFQKHLEHIKEKIQTNPEQAKHELQLLTHNHQQFTQAVTHFLDAINKITTQEARHIGR